jgi:UPF0042 nucleotide-binding protein
VTDASTSPSTDEATEPALADSEGSGNEYVVISGLSGAGRSTAADVLEDHGWFVIDNLPVALMPDVAGLVPQTSAGGTKVALVVGASSDPDELNAMLRGLRASGARVRTLFLDARTDVLVRRFESTRRRHPVSAGALLEAAIERERERLESVRSEADAIIDTSDLNVHELWRRVAELFEDHTDRPGMQVTTMSFGYKHGLPTDVDVVLDCRFLPNPHWVDELRPLEGRNPEVAAHVLGSDLAKEFLERVDSLLDLLLPAYEAEGKAYLTLAFGCTGGRHRSVAIAEEVAGRLRSAGTRVGVTHRDVDKPR